VRLSLLSLPGHADPLAVAPVFYTAGIYLVLASVVRASPAFASASLLRPRALLAIFIVADVLTTALQVAGAALIGVAESQRADGQVPPLTPEQANRILLAGLCVQVRLHFGCAAAVMQLTVSCRASPSSST